MQPVNKFTFPLPFLPRMSLRLSFLGPSYSMMVAPDDHENSTVTVNMAANNNHYAAAVGGRLTAIENNLDVSVCRGYTGYWCFLNHDSQTGTGQELIATMEMKKCGDTNMDSLTVNSVDAVSTILMQVILLLFVQRALIFLARLLLDFVSCPTLRRDQLAATFALDLFFLLFRSLVLFENRRTSSTT